MKKLANYCPLILLFLFATPKVNAQSVDVVIRDNGKERQERHRASQKYDLSSR